MDGKDIWPLIEGKEKQYYDHVTCAWGPVVMIRNQRWWYNTYLWGKTPLLFDLSNDPKLKNNVATEYPEVCEEMKNLAITDAGGTIPDYIRTATDRPGCSPLLGY